MDFTEGQMTQNYASYAQQGNILGLWQTGLGSVNDKEEDVCTSFCAW
jgi:hypothetical protein